jgi:hypothetical protein
MMVTLFAKGSCFLTVLWTCRYKSDKCRFILPSYLHFLSLHLSTLHFCTSKCIGKEDLKENTEPCVWRVRRNGEYSKLYSESVLVAEGKNM